MLAATVTANDPNARLVELRGAVHKRFCDTFQWVRDLLESEPPEVRELAQHWIEGRGMCDLDLTANFIGQALTKIRVAESIEVGKRDFDP